MKSKPYRWERSEFDTLVLGIPTAKIVAVGGATQKKIKTNVHALKEDLSEAGIRYAVCRISSSEYPTIQSLEEGGFVLIDGLITLGVSIEMKNVREQEFIVEAHKDDYAQLSRLAGTVFRGGSRYYHDPAISRRAADRVYREWIKNSLRGMAADTVLVWKEKGKVLGFITLQKKHGHGDIPLIGVSAKARGKGIGKSLIESAFALCAQWGMSEISVATQVTNIPALRLYQSCGFVIKESHVTLRWMSE
jgi:dTDP-4-amino-4,6-dideoxy-D-galactose acyltransferase